MTPTDSKKKTKGSGKAGTRSATPGSDRGRICPECRAENNEDSRFCCRCAAPLQDQGIASAGGPRTVRASTVELARGNRLAGRYEIVEELGRGGMGRVFKTYDHKISEMIALKLIRPEIGIQEKAIERFKNELKFTRKITHRNICRMYDLGEEELVYYITMEYVAGEDLKRFVKRAGQLTAGKAIMIASQVCDGLAEAHRIGAVHRDLKPQNIMIDHDGNAKIMDFGIARFTDMDRMTGSGVMIGTPEYMSPEQAEVKEVDARSDLYSLGVVLFEMVTGKVPFEGETTLSLAMKHKTEIPKNVRELNAQVPPGLAAVIARCLEKDPARRYQTALELKTALESSAGESAQKAVSPRAEAARPRKRIVPVIAAAAFVAVAAGAYFLFIKPGGPPAGPTAENGTAAVVPPPNSKSPAEEIPKPVVVEKKASGTEKKSAEAKPKPAPAESTQTPAQAKPAAPVFSAAEKQAADLAQARTVGARSLAAQQSQGIQSAFFRAGDVLREEAAAAAAGNRFVDARCLFTVSEKLFRLCLDEGGDPARWRALGKLAGDLRESALSASGGVPADPLFQEANNLITRGDVAWAKDAFETAVRNYAAAAVDYEKIRWTAQAAKKK